jgi:hypothetical protein
MRTTRCIRQNGKAGTGSLADGPSSGRLPAPVGTGTALSIPILAPPGLMPVRSRPRAAGPRVGPSPVLRPGIPGAVPGISISIAGAGIVPHKDFPAQQVS